MSAFWCLNYIIGDACNQPAVNTIACAWGHYDDTHEDAIWSTKEPGYYRGLFARYRNAVMLGMKR